MNTTPHLERPTAAGKVLWHFTMSLDGFVAGPSHDMSWLAGLVGTPGLEDEYAATTGAVIGGRAGWDAFAGTRPYSDEWEGSVFVLTHHPEDATSAPGVTFLTCDVAEAVRIAREAANGKNVEVLSASIGAQMIRRGLIDEIDLHIAPVLLGDGIRLFDDPGGVPVRLDRVHDGAPNAELDVRFRPARTADPR